MAFSSSSEARIRGITSRLKRSQKSWTSTKPRLGLISLSMVRPFPSPKPALPCQHFENTSPGHSHSQKHKTLQLTPATVDAASGGFVAPFTHAQAGAKWNFELPRVKSINTSGHKFGLVYAGVGWIIWRDESYLPKHLVFELHYLGGTEESYTLNFSRPGAQVIAQYVSLESEPSERVRAEETDERLSSII